jgi:hypothetical protein
MARTLQQKEALGINCWIELVLRGHFYLVYTSLLYDWSYLMIAKTKYSFQHTATNLGTINKRTN